MKITKLKRGWRINLTDTEMNVLRVQVEEGFSTMTEALDVDCFPLGPAEKRIMTEVFNMTRQWL